MVAEVRPSTQVDYSDLTFPDHKHVEKQGVTKSPDGADGHSDQYLTKACGGPPAGLEAIWPTLSAAARAEILSALQKNVTERT